MNAPDGNTVKVRGGGGVTLASAEPPERQDRDDEDVPKEIRLKARSEAEE